MTTSGSGQEINMLTWSNDVNLDEICEGMNKHLSKFQMRDYYVFGLQTSSRPHIRLSIGKGTPNCPKELMDLFERSRYTLEIKPAEGLYCPECDTTHTFGDCCCTGDEGSCSLCDPDTVSIGIRRDIRNNILTSKKLIKTIIFALESKLVIETKSKLELGRSVRKTPKKKDVSQQKRVSPLSGTRPDFSDMLVQERY